MYDNGDGTYDVIYVSNKEGALLAAKVAYNGEPIPNRSVLIYVPSHFYFLHLMTVDFKLKSRCILKNRLA